MATLTLIFGQCISSLVHLRVITWQGEKDVYMLMASLLRSNTARIFSRRYFNGFSINSLHLSTLSSNVFEHSPSYVACGGLIMSRPTVWLLCELCSHSQPSTLHQETRGAEITSSVFRVDIPSLLRGS